MNNLGIIIGIIGIFKVFIGIIIGIIQLYITISLYNYSIPIIPIIKSSDVKMVNIFIV